jgi:hypothetical protein
VILFPRGLTSKCGAGVVKRYKLLLKKKVSQVIAKRIVELLVVVGGSVAVGFLIGVLQHYLGFGVWGYGFEKDALELALFEGGITGAIVAIPTGLFVYYFCLGSTVSLRQVIAIVGGSLAGGCLLGVALAAASAFLTPLLTIGIALAIRIKESDTGSQ